MPNPPTLALERSYRDWNPALVWKDKRTADFNVPDVGTTTATLGVGLRPAPAAQWVRISMSTTPACRCPARWPVLLLYREVPMKFRGKEPFRGTDPAVGSVKVKRHAPVCGLADEVVKP